MVNPVFVKPFSLMLTSCVVAIIFYAHLTEFFVTNIKMAGTSGGGTIRMLSLNNEQLQWLAKMKPSNSNFAQNDFSKLFLISTVQINNGNNATSKTATTTTGHYKPKTIVPYDGKIDIVITYVNGSDPYIQAGIKQYYNASQFARHSANKGRFDDPDDLKYLLRSIDKYGTQIVNRVFLVLASPSQIPYWLNLEAPKLRLIYHADIWQNLSTLPTFNSVAIESNLHRIPDLGDYYLYFNDDVMLGQPLNITDFFWPKTKAIKLYRSSPSNTISNQLFPINHQRAHFENVQIRTFNLAKDTICSDLYKLNRSVPGAHNLGVHVPKFVIKPILEDAIARYSLLRDHVKFTESRRFRSGQEIDLHMLFIYNAYCRHGYQIKVQWYSNSGVQEIMVDSSVKTSKDVVMLVSNLNRIWILLHSAKLEDRNQAKMLDFQAAGEREYTQLGHKVQDYVNIWRQRLMPRKSIYEIL